MYQCEHKTHDDHWHCRFCVCCGVSQELGYCISTITLFMSSLGNDRNILRKVLVGIYLAGHSIHLVKSSSAEITFW